MKNFFYVFFLFLFIQGTILSQVPNSSFENWTGGNPDGWLTYNIPGVITPVTQTNSSHSGASAVKGEVESFGGTNYPPLLLSTNEEGLGFPVSTRYNSVKGWFKFNPVEGDRVAFAAYFTLNGEIIGGGAIFIETSISDYTEVSFPIDYTDPGTPDTCVIEILIVGPNGEDFHLGSQFYADDISLSEAVVSVEDNNNNTPFVFNLEQNYPNPFNPATSINYSIPQRSFVTLKVYNILGNEVARLVSETKEAGIHTVKFDASSLPSGVYIYSINAGNYTSSKKMILTK